YDILNGGAGNDQLDGGYGSDTYLVGRGMGRDTISNYDPLSGVDVVQFDSSVNLEDLWFRRDGYNLEVSVIGAADKAVVNYWYLSSEYRVDQFKTSDGKVLLESQVQNLVDKMASFGVDAGAEMSLSQQQKSELNVLLAANWK
ncbi:calcium-binding protein, partial [Pseudomonas oryzihabitans]|uniref:calcium-binding protein n=1 Tax=Pseudomonas oryzihabitans TaxID=47885 RepID=UPI0028939201